MKKTGFNKKGLCKLCKESRTDEGHDPCIANLPGVVFACCGHGIEKGYIKFRDGRVLKFDPLTIELDEALHEIVETKVPGRITGETFRVLNFKTKKTKTKRVKYGIDSIESLPMLITPTIRRRRGNRKPEDK